MATNIETFGTIDEELDECLIAHRAHDKLPEDAYHRRPEWSVSQFKLLPDEPELFYGRHVLKLPDWQQAETASMRLGTAFHAMVLLGEPLNIIPNSVLSKSGSRSGAAWQEWNAANPGGIKADEALPLQYAFDSLQKNRRIRSLLESPGLCEHSIFWTCEHTSLRLRGRLDKYIPAMGNGVILDLKTSNDPTPQGFPWKVLDLQYHVQAATYCAGVGAVFDRTPDAFLFIAVEVEPPYRCRLYEMSDDAMKAGYARMIDSLSDLDYRLKTNIWDTTDSQVSHTLNLPERKRWMQ